MPLDLSDTLVIGISATALFDLSEEDELFRRESLQDPDTAIENYRRQMLAREDDELAPGTGFPLISALLGLNRHRRADEAPLVEVVVMSRNSPETGLRVLKTIRSRRLPISRTAFTGGESVTDYLEAFDVDLFLTTSAKDAQTIIDSGACAAAVLSPPPSLATGTIDDQVRIAFDGDAVLFADESELLFKTHGLAAFHAAEEAAKDVPLGEGPYAALLKKLARLQERLPMRTEYSPVRIAIVTARNSPAEMRVINTLRHWGVYVDAAFFLGGVGKAKVLEAFRPHIFFEDQEVHIKDAASVVPAGKVPYHSGSALAGEGTATVLLPGEDGSQKSARRDS